ARLSDGGRRRRERAREDEEPEPPSPRARHGGGSWQDRYRTGGRRDFSSLRGACQKSPWWDSYRVVILEPPTPCSREGGDGRPAPTAAGMEELSPLSTEYHQAERGVQGGNDHQ